MPGAYSLYMKKIIVALIVIVIAAVITILYLSRNEIPSNTATSTTPISTTTAEFPPFDRSVSDKNIKISFSSQDYGLAVTPEQILARSYIPPCDSNFEYCLYYIGSNFMGTNFESAGLRIQNRADLKTEKSCLNTSPYGFTDTMMPSATTSSQFYSTAKFSNVGQGAAGHYSIGSLYRLFIPHINTYTKGFVKENSACYEFETRVGQSQFANYPPGAIKEFTTADQQKAADGLMNILRNISLLSGEKIVFPN